MGGSGRAVGDYAGKRGIYFSCKKKVPDSNCKRGGKRGRIVKGSTMAAKYFNSP